MKSVAFMSGHVLTDQFGSEGGRAWALCNGIDDRPVLPMPFDESVVEHISLPFFHSSSIEVLFVAVDSLLQRAYARPELRRRYARTAVSAMYRTRLAALGEDSRVQGASWRLGQGFTDHQKPSGGRPAGDARG